MKQIMYAVAVEHRAKDCPLKQTGPDMAYTLADNLATANLIGVFAMPAHKGVAIVEAGSLAAVKKICAQVLPKHLEPIVKRVPADSALRSFYIHPERLENAPNSVRYEVLAAAVNLFPEKKFEQVMRQQLPTLSLRSLPAYLRQNAPRTKILS